MFARWPLEFIHPSTTACGVEYPFAMFSPAVLYVIPKFRIISKGEP